MKPPIQRVSVGIYIDCEVMGVFSCSKDVSLLRLDDDVAEDREVIELPWCSKDCLVLGMGAVVDSG